MLARSARGVSTTVGKRRTVRSPSTCSTPGGYSLAQVKWSRAQVVRTSTSQPRSARPRAISARTISAPPTTVGPKRGGTTPTFTRWRSGPGGARLDAPGSGNVPGSGNRVKCSTLSTREKPATSHMRARATAPIAQ